jgi:hypothetical protein
MLDLCVDIDPVLRCDRCFGSLLAGSREAGSDQGALGYLREMFCMSNNAYRLYVDPGAKFSVNGVERSR